MHKQALPMRTLFRRAPVLRTTAGLRPATATVTRNVSTKAMSSSRVGLHALRSAPSAARLLQRRTMATATREMTPPPGATDGDSATVPQSPANLQSMPQEAGDQTVAITRKFTHSTVSEPSIKTGGDYTLPHPIWKPEYLEHVQITHIDPRDNIDKAAYYTVKLMRFNFDWMSGYLFLPKTEKLWLNRIIFLETVAGVPGSIGATVRHLASLRRLRRDHGWIHTLLEEAENERMHLLTAIKLRSPGPFFRLCILLTQGVFFNFYFLAYLLHPRFCHRLVGYLEEEAVITYTNLLKHIDRGDLWTNTPAPEVARSYWRLPATATMRDVVANIRADESHHRDVNHKFADIGVDKPNPYGPGH